MPRLATARGPYWVPTPFVWLCILLHLAAALGLLTSPGRWRLWIGAFLANQLLITFVSLWPRSALLGPNVTHVPPGSPARPSVVLTFDDGPHPEVTPRVLDLLDQYGAKASFFCVGERAVRFPHIAAEIVRRGHSVENHTHCHPLGFAFHSVGGFRREIGRAQDALTSITGVAPAFCRAPFGIRSPLLDPALVALPLRYVSWTRRGYDTVVRRPEEVLRRVTRDLAAGDILVLHDTAASRTSEGRPVVLDVLPALLQRIEAAGLRALSLPLAIAAQPAPESVREPAVVASPAPQTDAGVVTSDRTPVEDCVA